MQRQVLCSDAETVALLINSAYSEMIQNVRIIKRFYFEKEKLPTNFDSYTSIYDKLSSPTFGKLTFDYCFLEKNMSSIDARDATNATLLLTINNFSQIVDQVTILKELKTKENFEMYTNALNENARTQVNQILAMS